MHSVGLFLGDLMGPYVSLHIFACICLVPNVLFLFLFPLIPDSPHWHIMQNDLDQAETSLKWFRRREDVKQELFELWDYVSTSKISLRERIKELKDSSKCIYDTNSTEYTFFQCQSSPFNNQQLNS